MVSRMDVDVDLYFSEYYEIDPAVLEEYGAFDISVVSDLPLFVDPFPRCRASAKPWHSPSVSARSARSSNSACSTT